jgi:hypothetical protein
MIATSSIRSLRRAVLLPLALFCVALIAASACHAPGSAAEGKRTPVEKPWTKATIEKNEYLWLELKHNRRGFMTGPVLAHDEKGDYLTTKDDPSVHLPLDDVLVIDAIDAPMPQFEHEPIVKPWTKEVVEAHDKVWVETSNGRRQLLAAPTLAQDEKGEYITTKNDATVRVPLDEVTVLDKIAPPADASVSAGGVAAQSLGGSFLAFWTVVLFLLPAAILVAVLA